MTNQPRDPIQRDTTASDLTVLRGNTGPGGSKADAPRVLKQRFVLEAKLGSGGMGTVYRAKDLRKVEARDRDPYLAVKVLNNDFRAHPDAFIALQREAAKCQALSHPNIVSIYDFDKDGDIPYMTMELLKGQELGELLGEYPNGLPDAVAWPIIEGMCAGLKRAHDAGITHADFKPGNVFVTEDKGTKILDFGIARAVRANARFGDDTVFDPGKLAALTPAYASREMLLGDDPQPTDDIYSLAVVIYLMLTGRHPYQRTRADQAARDGLRPERIRKLGRRQWWVLERALDFHAENRPQHVDELIAGLIERPALKPWMTAALLIVALGIGVGLSLGPLSEERAVVALDTLLEAQVARVDQLLAAPAFDNAWQDRMAAELDQLATLDDGNTAFTETRARVLDAFLARIRDAPSVDAVIEALRGADLLLEGQHFEPGYAVLRGRLLGELDALLRADTIDRAWFDQVELQLLRFERMFPRSPDYAELGLAVGQDYVWAIDRLAARGELDLANELFALTVSRVFDYDDLERASARLEQLRADVEHERAVQIASEADLQIKADLEVSAGFVCQRLDGTELATVLGGLLQRHPDREDLVRRGVAERVAACVALLAETDQQHAFALRRGALELIGPQPALTELRFDPCSARHLVGAGASPGGLGVCRDALAEPDSAPGPDLVVVSDGERRFAIMRDVLGAGSLERCREQNCGVSATVAPERIGPEDAAAVADWLTASTGYTYRLPTEREWYRATGRVGPSAESEACQAPVTSGAAAGPFGLVGLRLGSPEWVVDIDATVALATDTATGCAVETPSASTGAQLRLVRDIP